MVEFVGVKPKDDTVREISVGGQNFPVDEKIGMALVPATLAHNLMGLNHRFIFHQAPAPIVEPEPEPESPDPKKKK